MAEILKCSGQHGVIGPYKNYSKSLVSRLDSGIVRTLNLANTKNLYNLSATLGEANVVGASKLMDDLRVGLSATSGSISGTYSARSNKFVMAVKNYQDSLLAYREIVRSKEATGQAKTAPKRPPRTLVKICKKCFRMK